MALTDDKYQQKRQALLERTMTALSCNLETAERLLRVPRRQSLRINTLVANTDETLRQLQDMGIHTKPYSWIDHGVSIEDDISDIRDSTLVANGAVYIQNAASWLPVVALDPSAGDLVLDVCAAPGGKTSHIAQLTSDAAVITANDNSRPRLHKLQANLTRLGVKNVETTLHDATRLAKSLPLESFDAILLDAPCSGEGMMSLDNKKDFESWSVAHIKRLQQLQKKLIIQAWQLLKPGGTLVYSTCTMAPEENEAVIDYLLRRSEDAQLESLDTLRDQLDNTSPAVLSWNNKQYNPEIKKTLRLHPSEQVEAFFVAKITKNI